jgi:hypothetical protein
MEGNRLLKKMDCKHMGPCSLQRPGKEGETSGTVHPCHIARAKMKKKK